MGGYFHSLSRYVWFGTGVTFLAVGFLGVFKASFARFAPQGAQTALAGAV